MITRVFEKHEVIMKHNFVANDRAKRMLRSKHYCVIDQATGTGKTYQIFQIILDAVMEGWYGSEPKILIVVPGTVLESEWSDNFGKEGKFWEALNPVKAAVKKKNVKEETSGSSNLETEFSESKTIKFEYTVISYVGLNSKADLKKDVLKTKDGLLKDLPATNAKNIRKFTSNFDLIFFDEVHHASADTSYPVVKEMLNSLTGNQCALGVTATLEPGPYGTSVLFNGNIIHGIQLLDAQEGRYEKWSDEENDKSVMTQDLDDKGKPKYLLPGVDKYAAIIYDKSLVTSRLWRTYYEDYISAVLNDADAKASLTDGEVRRLQQFRVALPDLFEQLTPESLGKEMSDLVEGSPKKILCFYPLGENPKKVVEIMRKIFGINNVDYLSSKNDTKEDLQKVKDFKNTKTNAILCSVNKLGEGVHPGRVSAIVMMRRTFSERVFFQQIGRIMDTKDANKKIPVFDLAGNMALEDDARENGLFDKVEEFMRGARNSSKELPSMARVRKGIEEMMSLLKKANLKVSKVPDMRVVNNGHKILAGMMGILPFPQLLKKVDSKATLRHAWEQFFAERKKSDTTDWKQKLDIDDIGDEEMVKALLLRPDLAGGSTQKKKDQSPHLSIILDNQVKKHGKFASLDDLKSWVITQFTPAEKATWEKELSKSWTNKYVAPTEEARKATVFKSLLEGKSPRELFL